MKADLTDTRESREQGAATVHLDQQSVGRLSRMDALQGQAMAKATEARAQQHLRLITRLWDALKKGATANASNAASQSILDPWQSTPALYCMECTTALS